MIALSFIQKAFAELLCGLLDTLLYTLLNFAYYIFTQVAKINLFGGSVAEAIDLYDGFTSRVYTILSVVMIFVLAYQIILMIINPDSKADKSTGLIKDILISLIFIAVCPTIFSYMGIFQDHIISDGTITNIVLGTTTTNQDAGKNFSMVVLHSLYHPVGTTFSTFFADNGNLKEKSVAVEECKRQAKEELCESWWNALEGWSLPYVNGPGKLTANGEFHKVIGDNDGIEYYWIICTGVAALILYFLVSYTIDLGTRAVKLGFLQLIAPIELILKVIPSMKKNFDKWLNQLIKTYIDVFLKLFVISFIIQICILIPRFVEIVFNSTASVNKSPVKCVAIVCLILGLLAFAKEAPTLLKELFGGNDLFAGVDLKPGVKKRLDNNTYAKAGLSMAAQGIGGGIGNASRRIHEMKKYKHEKLEDGKTDNPDYVPPGFKRALRGIGGTIGAIGGALGGTIDGIANGAKNSQEHMSVKDTIEQFSKGAEYASSEGKKRQEQAAEVAENSRKKWGKRGTAAGSKINGFDGAAAGGKIGQAFGSVTGSIDGFIRTRGDWKKGIDGFNEIKNAGHDAATNWKENVLTGNYTGTQEGTEVLQTMSSVLKSTEVKVNLDNDAVYQGIVNGAKEAVSTIMSGGKYRGKNYANVTPESRLAEAKKISEEFEKSRKEYANSKRQEYFEKNKLAAEQQRQQAENLKDILSKNSNKLGKQVIDEIEKVLPGQGNVIQKLDAMSKSTSKQDLATNAEAMAQVQKIVNQAAEGQKASASISNFNKGPQKPADGGKK